MSHLSERELAKWLGCDLAIEDHGWLVLDGHFEYEGGSCQGLGYFATPAFLMRFMGALGVTLLSDMDGVSCWVTHSHTGIEKIEPLHKKGGVPFVIAEWQDWEDKHPSASPYEMRTGKKP